MVRVEVATIVDAAGAGDGAVIGEADRSDGHEQPRLDLGYKSDQWGRFFGEAAMTEPTPIGTIATDPPGLVGPEPTTASGTGLGVFYIGWSPDGLLGETGNTITLSVGRQDIRAGDSLVVWDPQNDPAADGTPAKVALLRTAILAVEAGPARGDIFYLRSDRGDGADVAGLNLALSESSLGTLDGGYYKVVGASDPTEHVKADVMTMRASDFGPPILSRIDIQGEYVDDPAGTSTAFGSPTSFVEAGYRLRNGLPWASRLAYRYSFATGGATDDAPLFDAARGWGPWQNHQAVGACLLLDRHNQAHSLHLSVQPNEGLDMGALYHSLHPAVGQSSGDPLWSANSVDAFGLYADWKVGDRLSFGVAGGLALPRGHMADAPDESSPLALVEASLILSF